MSNPALFMNIYKDYWCDGHYIAAFSAEDAREKCAALFDGYRPILVRPWTDADQAELDRQSGEGSR